jgi:hypothetical protein
MVDRSRAKHPEDAGLRAAWEQLYQVQGFVIFGVAAGIAPYLEKLIGRSLSDWQPLIRGAIWTR